MARGDVVSDSYVAIGNGATVDIQPASGDEWVVTWIGASTGGVGIRGNDGSNATDDLVFGNTGSNTNETGQIQMMLTGRPFRLIITNAQYFRFAEQGTANETGMYSAIKSKD